MESKIKQLAEVAKTRVPAGLDVSEWIEKYNEIFAGLIIEECIEVIWDSIPILSDEELNDLASKAYGKGMHDCMHLIENHFGVEE